MWSVGFRKWRVSEGFTSSGAQTLQAAREQLSSRRPDVVLTDLRLPDGEGIELVQDMPQSDPPELIVVTGYATIDSAVAALRAGATDYLVKPVELDRVQAVLRQARKTAALRSEIGVLRTQLRRLGRFGRLLGSAPSMQHLYDQLGRVAPTSATVLLLGESGTGKELAALTLHELSRRRDAPFLPLNCGAVGPAHRKRAVRSRARQFYRRRTAAQRVLRAGARRQCVPG